MATNENLIPIPGRLHSVATEGHVAGADEIYDDNLNKLQSTINGEVDEIIDDVALIDTSSQEQAVVPEFDPESQTVHVTAQTLSEQQKAQVRSNIGLGDVDAKINQAVASEASQRAAAVSAEQSRAQGVEATKADKSDTYTKAEVNDIASAFTSQKYETYEATAQTTAATDVLPASGSADTVYRVGNWDGTQYSEADYTEYAWNGSAYIKLSTKSQVGEVYDISANHAGVTYADLETALGTNGANIPQSLRKGGMSVKYVCSSDNKYVQYTSMTSSFSTTPSDWQGVGQEEPNMRIDLIAGTPQEEIDLDSYIENNYIISSNVWSNPSGYKCKLIYFKPYRGKTITVTANSNYNGDIAFLKNNNVVIGNSVNYCDSATREYIITKGDSSTFIVPSDCNYLYVYTLSGGTKVTTPESLIIQQYKGAIGQLQDEIDICNDGILGNYNNIKNLNKLNNDRLFGVSNKDINFSFYPNTGYTTSGGNWAIIQNYDSKVIPFAAYAGGLLTVTANNDYNTEIGFLKSNNLSAGAAIDYCQGYTGNKWIQKGTSISIEIPNDCAYLYIYILSNNHDTSPSVLKVIKSEGLFPVINDNKKVQKDDSDGFYVGNIINLKNYWKRETFRTTTLNIHQSFAIYNKYMITADYSGEGTALDGATCFGQIYDIETKQILGDLTFPFGNYNRPHANTICFGCEFAPGNTDLPLLYISSWDYENERGVFVYNVYKNNNVWTAELVQTIIPDIESITTAIIGAGATDWIVDTDEESLYSLAYYLAGPSTLVEGNKEMIVKFRLPKLSEGSLVTLTLSDVLDNYEERILNISQDKTYYKGKIYVISGLGQSYPNMSNLWVIDLLKKSIVSRIKLPLIWGELEGLSVYNDELLFDKGSTALYKFVF